jgi:hypothetical protein
LKHERLNKEVLSFHLQHHDTFERAEIKILVRKLTAKAQAQKANGEKIEGW